MKAKIIRRELENDGSGVGNKIVFGMLIDNEYFECDKLLWRIKCALDMKNLLGKELQISIPNQLTDAEEYSLASMIKELIINEESKEIGDTTRISALNKLGTILDIEL